MTRGPILCAIDDDDSLGHVIDTGVALADATGLTPVYAHVVQVELHASSTVIPVGAAAGWAPFPEGGYHEAERRARERGVEFLASLGFTGPQARVAAGDPAAELQDIASEIDAEAIVAGGRPGGALKALSTGSVVRRLTVNGDRPVVLARPPHQLGRAGGPVVCGVASAADDALRVAGVAARFAAMLGRRLVLVHVGNFGIDEEDKGIGYERLFGGSRADALRRLYGLAEELPDGIPVEAVIESGWEPKRLAAQADARAAALIVVGNRGRGPIRSALAGSVSLELANSARQVVVVVPSGS